jgi:hypothetical protein
MKRRYVLLLFLAAIGLTLANSNYQFQFYRQEEGWVVLDEGNLGEPQTIEHDAFKVFGTATTSDDYVDSTQSTTYGTITNGPPNGMGDSDTGSSYDTHLTEAAFTDGSWTTTESQTTFATDEGFYDSDMSFNADGIGGLNDNFECGSGGSGYLISADASDFSSGYSKVDFRIRLYGRWSTGEIVIAFRDSGGTYDDMDEPEDTPSSWLYYSVESSDSQYRHSGFRARINHYDITGLDECYGREWRVRGYSTTTCYRFQAVFKFTGVDADYPSATLYVDFYSALSGSDDLDFYLEEGDTTPANLVADNKQDDFSVDITSYLSSGSVDVYLDIRDDYRSGDTSQTTAYIQRCYIHLENHVPSVDADPTCSNLDDSTKMYARYREYEVTVQVSDADGYSDIKWVDLWCYNQEYTAIIYELAYNEDTDTFSEYSNTNDYVTLNAGACSAVRSGNDIDATFVFMINWNHPIITDIQWETYVNDAYLDSDYLDSPTTWDIETRLDLAGWTFTDYSGTADRGNYDSIGTIKFISTVVYLDSGGEERPASDEVDVWVICADIAGSPWSDTTLDNGQFEIWVDSDDEVGLDTYTFKVVEEGAGSGGADLLYTTHTDTYIADRVIFSASASHTWTIVGYDITANIYATYEYDGTPYTGSVSWTDETNGTVSHSTAGKYWFYATSFTDTTHGITKCSNSTAHCIWDSLEISSGPAYYWTQYSETAVWLIWGAPSTYVWAYNESLASGIRIQSLMNGTESAWAITSSGSIAGLAIGPFTPAWWHANITVIGEYGEYEIPVWSQTLEVDILHSLQIVSFSIVPTDDYFWIQYQTNLMNASMAIWDDVVDSGTLFSDNIYYSLYEGMHQLPRDDTIGVHNVTICITSTGTEYDRDYTFDYYTWWYNFTYVVQEDPSIYETNLVIIDPKGMELPYGTFEVYKNGTRVHSDATVTYSNQAYNITVKDRWGLTLNSTVFPAGDYEFAIEVQVHTLKVMSWHPDFVYVNLTRSGFTWREVITPTETVSLHLFEGSYYFVVDYRNGSTVNGNINLVDSDALIVTGSTITDVAGYTTTLLAMTTEINVTVSATNNYVLEIQIDLENVNTTINEQLIQVLLNITNTNTTLYSQTVDLLAYLQNVNTTLYEQTAAFIIGVYNNHTTIYNQNVEILSTLSAIGSNVTANYISLSSTLSLIDSSLAANFTEIVADLTAISSDVTSNYISLSAQLSAIDSSLLANFTSISATLSMLDSSLLSNFTEVVSRLTAVGSNVTANYLSLSATLSAIDSSLLSNFTSISATLTLMDSNLLSNFTQVLSELNALGNSNLTADLINIASSLNLMDSSLLSNFTQISSSLNLIDSSLLSNFTNVLSEINALGNSNLTADLLSISSRLSLIDSSLLTNFTTLTAELHSVNSSILAEFVQISAVLSMLDSSLLSNYTAITANLTAIGTNITTNHLVVAALLTAISSNITTNHLSIVALLNAVDSSISASEINIIAAIGEIPIFRGVTTSELINIISASIGVEWLDMDGDGRPDTVSQPLKDQLPKPQEDLPFWLISIVILLVILAVLIRLGRNLAPTVYQMIKNSRSLKVQLANS